MIDRYTKPSILLSTPNALPINPIKWGNQIITKPANQKIAHIDAPMGARLLFLYEL